MNEAKLAFWMGVLLIGLILTGCAGYYSGNGHYTSPYSEYPYYNNGYYYDYGHHREFGQSPKWDGEHQGSGGHSASGEHHNDRD